MCYDDGGVSDDDYDDVDFEQVKSSAFRLYRLLRSCVGVYPAISTQRRKKICCCCFLLEEN